MSATKLTVVSALLIASITLGVVACASAPGGSSPFAENATSSTLLEVGSSMARGDAIVYVRVDDLPRQRAGRVTPAGGFTTLLRGVADGPRAFSTVAVFVDPREGPAYRLDQVVVQPGDRIRVHVGPSQVSSEIMVLQGR